MKNFSLILACLFILTGCKKSEPSLETKDFCAEAAATSAGKTENDDRFRTKREVISIGDSIGNYKVVADLPVAGKPAVRDSVTKHILLYCVNTEMISDRKTEEPKNLSQPVLTIKKAGEDFVENAHLEKDDLGEDDFFAPHSINYEMLMEHNTPKYITYNFKGYTYTGGAHGMPFDCHRTWDSQTGKTVTWKDLFEAKYEKQIIRLIKQAILKSKTYADCDESDFWEFVRPTETPGVTPRGIVFHYSAYEICCYAMGLPECTLSFKTLEPYMTPYGKNLVK